MFGKNQISDKDLLKAINQRLARTGTASQSKVNVSVQQGNVVLTGTLQHAIQRSPIVKAISRVTGVRRVVDQMLHAAKKVTRSDAHQNAHLPASTAVVESSGEDVNADAPADEQPRPE
jgi:phosphoribosylformylglycinamidine (FGAM) synthase-like enzyme